MEKYPFQIKELEIRKIPGFPHGLKHYEDLSAQINIIAGPNASGKSTTAAAVQKLIWRNQTGGLQINGRIKIDEEHWSIDIDSHQVVMQRNGIKDELNGLPAAEDRDRYMLALHELVSHRGENLVAHIIKESIGGYDLEKAADRLEYSADIKTSRIGEYKAYNEAQKQVQKQSRKQKELKKEQEKLAGLYKEKD
ncbi:MAG TPA: hypothetical protein VK106_06990, partial [Balneolaceae bacterium]|nr:hypothetical protein [Balneolaceae bacterium]